MSSRVLVVDDEPEICRLVKEILEDEGFLVSIAESGKQARARKDETNPDLILLDIWMPDIDGITLLKEWKNSNTSLAPVIMMSGHGTVETAVEATRLGAYDFLEKPLSLAKLVVTAKNALEASQLHRENLRLRQYSHPSAEIIGKSKAMTDLREQIQRISGHETPVLVHGESGTDKDTIARYLHAESNTRDGPFVSVSVSALDENAAGAEIFGKTEDGVTHTGQLEKAAGGSLFLKDIADLHLAAQAKLQSAIEKGSFSRIGDLEPLPINARVIAATRFDLNTRVKDGEFRDDLYFQLSVVPVRVLPLREHYEDIPELLEYYVNYFVEQDGLPYRHFSTAAQNRLRRYNWPGNTRELKNLVQRMLILGSDEIIELEEIEAALGEQSRSREDESLHNFDMPLREARDRFERAYLEYQLKQANGSVSRIAKVVGMERTHLYRKLKSLGITLKG